MAEFDLSRTAADFINRVMSDGDYRGKKKTKKPTVMEGRKTKHSLRLLRLQVSPFE